ncbi:unnamed protein product [Chironomus riparius]|uniref:C-type lectin domain-containing protein n=1 Tax=Chironomus riparius TaxID=315576 RepID=A0A9N9WVZ3_9DIPT|nr:unnamed protein product [Chironomus riparius]
MKFLVLFLILSTSTLGKTITDQYFPFYEKSLPKTENCGYTKDLFDNGVYLKTACFVHQSLNHDSAKYKCAEYNMNLFVMNNEVVASHLQDATQDRYPGINGKLWINGKRQTASKRWQVYNIDGTVRGSLNSNIKFYSNHELGNCLRLSPKYTGIFDTLPGNCADTAYFACEHFQRTQDPPALNTSPCLYVRDLYSHSSYLKSMCVVNQDIFYDQARRKCAEYGMNLFIFDTAEVDEAFFEAIDEIIQAYPTGWFFVNGVRDPKTNEWNVYYSNRVLKGKLYENFEFVQVNNTFGISSGNYLRISAERGPYQGFGVGVTAKSWPICEFIKNY